jgi:hypothetical protein
VKLGEKPAAWHFKTTVFFGVTVADLVVVGVGDLVGVTDLVGVGVTDLVGVGVDENMFGEGEIPEGFLPEHIDVLVSEDL